MSEQKLKLKKCSSAVVNCIEHCCSKTEFRMQYVMLVYHCVLYIDKDINIL